MEVEKALEFGSPGKRWRDAIDKAGKWQAPWEDRGKKVVDRYRDEREHDTESKKFNILWSNVQTMQGVVYNKPPKPQVSRRYKQKDDIGKNAALVLERALAFSVEAYDFDALMRHAVEDYLLPGRAVARVKYVPRYGDPRGEEGEAFSPVEYEEAQCEYHFWQDFRHGPGRCWEDVGWVAFRHYPDRSELERWFGKKLASQIKLDHSKTEGGENQEQFKKAQIWEIWSKSEQKVHWLAYADSRVVLSTPPKLSLHGFFPCPKPLYSLVTNDSLLPVPDYTEYQDQARELDELSERIGILVKALRVVGIYAGEHKMEIAQLFNTVAENQMIPVDSWAAYADKGGLRGAIEWVPIEQVIRVVTGLYEARDRTKQELYEITGLSDILRGASNPNETATAQRIKGQFGSMRLQDRQVLVAQFARDLLRLKAEVICEEFQVETLMAMTGLEFDPQMWAQIMDLLRNDPLRTFKIDIETESTLQADEEADKAARNEFLQSMTGFLQVAAPMAEDEDLKPVMAEMVMFAVRGYKAGRELEEVFETAMENLTATDEDLTPEEQAEQEQARQLEQAQQELAMRKEVAAVTSLEADNALKQIEGQERQLGMQKLQMEMQLLPLDGAKTQAETQNIQADTAKTAGEAQQAMQPAPVETDPVEREMGRAERLLSLQKSRKDYDASVVDLAERQQALKAQNKAAGPKAIKMVRDPDTGTLRGEITDANGETTFAEVSRDENGDLSGTVGSDLKYNPLTGDIGADDRNS